MCLPYLSDINCVVMMGGLLYLPRYCDPSFGIYMVLSEVITCGIGGGTTTAYLQVEAL
jgi:hypothetical protein